MCCCKTKADFEERERVLFAVVLVGFVLSLALAVFLGWVLARKVMAPVVRLARQVRHRDQLLGLAPPLAPDYAADEVGELAVAFDATLGRLRAALSRRAVVYQRCEPQLRTPLMVLASSCELLLENPAIDQRGRNQVQRIARACEEMRELVQTFLMLARAQHNDASMSAQVTLSQVADDLLGIWREQIEHKGLELIYQPGNPLDTRYNTTFLHAVMGNLLRNALHYTEHGFIRLTLEPAGFVVEDSGVGIPEEKREAMFEPFVRGSEKRGDGLGLGFVAGATDLQRTRAGASASAPWSPMAAAFMSNWVSPAPDPSTLPQSSQTSSSFGEDGPMILFMSVKF